MTGPLINILIRASRLFLLDKCLESIEEQTYKNVNLIVAYEGFLMYSALEHRGIQNKIMVKPVESLPYYWNLYCNDLKKEVKDGYFFYMDDDDYLAGPDVLEKLAQYLQVNRPEGVIVQFIRNGKPKPNNALIEYKVIKKGLIGGGCMVLHSKHKHLADWDGNQAADFRWIETIAKQIPLHFTPLVVQVAGNNGLHGKQS